MSEFYKFIPQRGKSDCNICCLAMLSENKSYEEIEELYFKNSGKSAVEGLTNSEEMLLLLQMGIKFNIYAQNPYLCNNRLYLLTIFSSAYGLHRIVVLTKEGEFEVYDPALSAPYITKEPFSIYLDVLEIVRD